MTCHDSKFYKSKYALAALLVSTRLFAADVPGPITQVTDSPAFDNQVEASKAALTIANQLANGVEFGGMIIETNGKFFYTEAVTINETSYLKFRIRMHKNSTLVAIYHIHPKSVVQNTAFSAAIDAESAQFSSDDINTATSLNITSYIFVQYDNSTRVFVPGKTHTHIVKNVIGNLERMSNGEII